MSKCKSQQAVRRGFSFRFVCALSMGKKLLGTMYRNGNASMITLSYTGTAFQFPRDPCTQLPTHLTEFSALIAQTSKCMKQEQRKLRFQLLMV
ncbi:hypothetical protein F3Y22_tig00110678pilonHSYRG00030 [Hibiscus syriacus]|uniref:Uncharacterized protein n=1 Tax=Hibiscus syriacus TaxID=106335 RepID=A0A6A2ZWA4_HIBSY|nr:hypothetical protein F3Y22_tig00110678pilonHSYRG00030 [Hibiscus syriacus]